jgi:hypothetical protein
MEQQGAFKQHQVEELLHLLLPWWLSKAAAAVVVVKEAG